MIAKRVGGREDLATSHLLLVLHTRKKIGKHALLNARNKFKTEKKNSCEEWRKQKKRRTPLKVESKKQAKKVVFARVLGMEVPIEPQDLATSNQRTNYRVRYKRYSV